MAPVKCDCLGEILRQGADGLREQAVFRPFGKDGQTGDNGVDEGLGCGNCLFRSRLDVDGVIGCVSKGEGRVFTREKVSAPPLRALSAKATMSGLLPDCDTAKAAARSSRSFVW